MEEYGAFFEVAPKNAAIVWNTTRFDWTDQAWLDRRRAINPFRSPMSVYEVHLGSWRKKALAQSFTARELAATLVDYVRRLGFTHPLLGGFEIPRGRFGWVLGPALAFLQHLRQAALRRGDALLGRLSIPLNGFGPCLRRGLGLIEALG